MTRTRTERPQIVVEGTTDMTVRQLKQFVAWAFRRTGLAASLRLKSFKHVAAREAIHGKTERKRLDGKRK